MPTTIDITVQPASDQQLSVAIADTGIGIGNEDLPRLFDPFDRLGHQTIEGTGIGLTLTQRLTTLMGGHLDAESTLGRGSIFTLTMPTTDPHRPPTVERDTRHGLIGRAK